MADQIQQPQTGQGKGARRAKRLSTKIDLTPMVDLGFLLITFFILTTTWSEAKDLEMLFPAGDIRDTKYGESTALTIILLESDKVFYYHGKFDEAVQRKSFGITTINGVRRIIAKKQEVLDHNPKYTYKDLALIIKPSSSSLYKNIVDIMDEVIINKLKHYSFVDVDSIEEEFIAQNKTP